jgi:hypothetical protein
MSQENTHLQKKMNEFIATLKNLELEKFQSDLFTHIQFLKMTFERMKNLNQLSNSTAKIDFLVKKIDDCTQIIGLINSGVLGEAVAKTLALHDELQCEINKPNGNFTPPPGMMSEISAFVKENKSMIFCICILIGMVFALTGVGVAGLGLTSLTLGLIYTGAAIGFIGCATPLIGEVLPPSDPLADLSKKALVQISMFSSNLDNLMPKEPILDIGSAAQLA